MDIIKIIFFIFFRIQIASDMNTNTDVLDVNVDSRVSNTKLVGYG